MRIALLVLGSVATLVLLVVAIGYALPVSHLATRAVTVRATPDQVFGLLTDVASYPAWRPDVTSVEVLASQPARWREHGGNGDITFVVDESVRPSRLVTRIDDPSLPFGGTWTFVITPAAEGASVTITERGEVYNPLFRFMSRFVFGHTATIDTYLTALQKRLS